MVSCLGHAGCVASGCSRRGWSGPGAGQVTGDLSLTVPRAAWRCLLDAGGWLLLAEKSHIAGSIFRAACGLEEAFETRSKRLESFKARGTG